MRIAQITDTFLPVVDGVGRVVVAYAEHLPLLGHEITVCTPMYNTGHRGGLPYEIVDFSGFKVPTSPQYKTGVPVIDAHYRKRMDMISLDIVHAHSPFAAGSEALRLSKQRSIPLVATFHSKYYDDFLKATKSRTISKALVAAVVSFFAKCDEVWAVSHGSSEVLRKYGFKGSVHVMSNGTELRKTDDTAVKRANELFQLGDKPVFLFVGQINWKKNILQILEAAALLNQINNNFKLVLAGQGPDEKEINKKAISLGLTQHLVMTGMISDTKLLDALYARALLFVFPSLYDTFSLVVREAAAMGTPSVVVKNSCASEQIIDRFNGYLCDDNPKSLCNVMQMALADKSATKLIGNNAQNSLPIPWLTIMKQVEERYKNLIIHYQPKPHHSHFRYSKRNKLKY